MKAGWCLHIIAHQNPQYFLLERQPKRSHHDSSFGREAAGGGREAGSPTGGGNVQREPPCSENMKVFDFWPFLC